MARQYCGAVGRANCQIAVSIPHRHRHMPAELAVVSPAGVDGRTGPLPSRGSPRRRRPPAEGVHRGRRSWLRRQHRFGSASGNEDCPTSSR
nr:hypothetical protein [Streptomyces sp. BK208]